MIYNTDINGGASFGKVFTNVVCGELVGMLVSVMYLYLMPRNQGTVQNRTGSIQPQQALEKSMQ